MTNEEIITDIKFSYYHIIKKLGEDGMGDVYLTEDAKPARKMALKISPAAFVADKDRMNQFVCEVHPESAIKHPNVINVNKN